MKRTVGILMAIFVVVVFSSTLFAAECTKEEVKAKVDEVAAIVEKEGRAYFPEIPKIRFCGDNYAYIIDMTCTVVAHGFQPHLVGKCLIGLSDDTGFKMMAKLLEGIKSSQATKDGKTYYNGTMWIKYRWPTPTDKTKFHTKLVYGKGILMPNGENVYVCAGMNLD